MLLLTNDLSNSGSTWTEMIAACRPQAQREAVEKRSTDSPSYPFLYRHITFYRIQCTQDGMKIVLLFFIRKKDAGLCHVSHQLSPQFTFNLMNPIIFVCLPWGCLPPQRKSGNVLFCILHTCSIRTRALWILISHFVISRYQEERFVHWNVRRVFVSMWRELRREIYIFLLAVKTVGRDSAE